MSAHENSWESMPVELRAQLERQLLRAHRTGTSSANASSAPMGTAISSAKDAGIAKIPLSFSQQRFWFLDQYETNSSVYNISRAFRLHGNVNPAALERALSAIVERHESLRTKFTIVGDEPVQRISRNARVCLSIVDLSTYPPDERERQLMQLLTTEARRPFRLSEDLMLRAVLYRLDAHDHALIVATHHVASDGWSQEILLRELSQLYAANLLGRNIELRELPMQYAQFAIEQRDSINRGAWKRQLEYWKQCLEGMPALLKLPTDAPRPARESFRGQRCFRSLSGDLAPALRRIGQESGVTLFMTLLGALKVLLSRYTGEDDIFVGSPVAGRSRIETEGLIGLFVNTIVLRTDLSGDPTFRELLLRVRETALGAFCHQELPFERLVEVLRPERNLGHSPLYQVMFALQNTAQAVLNLPGTTVTPIALEPGTAKLDLTWEAIEFPDRLELRVEYNSDLFREETIARMIDHFQVLLQSIIADPDRPISQLPILTESERERILEVWSTSSPPWIANRVDNASACTRDSHHLSGVGNVIECCHRQFEEHAARNPDRIALCFEDEQFTYREFNERANRLAHYLQQMGVGPETLVGVCLSRSPRMLVALLAVLKAGGAYVPLEPDLPPARLRMISDDSQAGIVVTDSESAVHFEDSSTQTICLDIEAPLIDSQSSTNPISDVSSDHPCYVLYTSGSTGQPKGVLVLHRNVSNFLESFRHEPGFRSDDVMAASAQMSFDASVLELFVPLVTGGRIVLVDRETAREGYIFQQALRQHGVTVMFATPTGCEILLEAGPLPDGLKLLCGGEALRPGLAAMLLKQGIELWNGYGPTETTVMSTIEKIDTFNPILIGRPIANTDVYVLDPFRQPVPVGVPGELYIGGAGVARGYWNRPELTSEKFVPHPFSSNPDARLYRSGDSVRWHADGRLEYLGRIDHQVKIRGFRIEIEEIEQRLAAHPQIKECVVVSQEVGANRTKLAAYFVPANGATVETVQLREWLSHQLPDYMVPRQFSRFDALPRLPNGKLDRKSLSMESAEGSEERSSLVAPTSELEKALAEIWKEVLRLKQVGVHDNFFDLGGHSLSAMRVVTRLLDRFQVEVSVRAIFEAPTISQLSRLLSDTRIFAQRPPRC